MSFCVNPDGCELCGEGGEIRICGCGLRCCGGCWSELYDCCRECAEDAAKDRYWDLKTMGALGK
jgi:hypothetical protein